MGLSTNALDGTASLSPVSRAPADVGGTLASRGFVTAKLDDLVNWARTGSMWPMTFGVLCDRDDASGRFAL